jgi:hypothetical protein
MGLLPGVALKNLIVERLSGEGQMDRTLQMLHHAVDTRPDAIFSVTGIFPWLFKNLSRRPYRLFPPSAIRRLSGEFILNSFVAAVQLLRSASQGADSETGFPLTY